MFGRPVLAHRPELHQVAVGHPVADREQQVEVADHVRVLGLDRGLARLHRVGRRGLLAVVDDRLGQGLGDHRVEEARRPRSCRRTDGSRCPRPRARPRSGRPARRSGSASRSRARVCQRRREKLSTIETSWPRVGEPHRGRPAEVPVTTEDQDPHSAERVADGAGGLWATGVSDFTERFRAVTERLSVPARWRCLRGVRGSSHANEHPHGHGAVHRHRRLDGPPCAARLARGRQGASAAISPACATRWPSTAARRSRRSATGSWPSSTAPPTVSAARSRSSSAVARHNREVPEHSIGLRIGISTGEATFRRTTTTTGCPSLRRVGSATRPESARSSPRTSSACSPARAGCTASSRSASWTLKGLPAPLAAASVEWTGNDDDALRVAIAEDSVLLREGIVGCSSSRGDRGRPADGRRRDAARRPRRRAPTRRAARRAHATDPHDRGPRRGSPSASATPGSACWCCPPQSRPARPGGCSTGRPTVSATCSRNGLPTAASSRARSGRSRAAGRRSTPRWSRSSWR